MITAEQLNIRSRGWQPTVLGKLKSNLAWFLKKNR